MIEDVFKYQSTIQYNFTELELQKIQNHICNEHSKYVYSNCLLYSITKDLYYIKNLVLTTDEGKRVFQKLREIEKPILIFGAGKRGKQLVDIFEDIPWEGFVDNIVWDSEYQGIPIVTFNEARKKWPDAFYVVSPLFGYAEIEKQLMEAGIASQDVLTIERYNKILAEKIYIDSAYIPYSKARVFADCGGYNGDDTKKFLDLNEHNKIFLFEPNTEMYEICRKRFMQYNVSLYNKGLYSEKKQCSFEYSSGGMSNIKSGGSKEIAVDTLDHLVGEKIDFLKMDIEGSEYEAIVGAKNLISRDRPAMAISVYHKEEDIWRLPLKLLEYDETYQFEFRHYSLGQVDTIMYVF